MSLAVWRCRKAVRHNIAPRRLGVALCVPKKQDYHGSRVVFSLTKRTAVLFRKEDRLSLFLLSVGIFLNSFMEVIGIGLIVPFISLLAHPEALSQNIYLNWTYQFFGFKSFLQFMVALAVLIVVVFVIKNTLLLVSTFLQSKFIYDKRTLLSTRLFNAYLMSPYTFHLSRNLGQFQQKLGAVADVMHYGVLQVINLLTEGLLVFCLVAILLKTNFAMTVAAIAVLGGGFFLYYYLFKDRIYRWGETNSIHTALLCQQINQGLGSIKESKLLGKEHFFVNKYLFHSDQMAQVQIKNDIATKSPRLFIETMVIALVMAAMALLLIAGQAPGDIFTTVSLFAIVTVRLMPSLNRISSSWSGLKYFMPNFNAIYDDLMAAEKAERQSCERMTGTPLSFHHEIIMRDVGFYYENATKPALDSVSLNIKKNSVAGFIGPSGAGKTTAVDIILGLLMPTSGKVMVDGVDIHTHLRSWQTKIGYIPQTIYLCDDTIRNNVAFGLEAQEIADEKVWQSLRLAQLDDFVKSLPQGVETKVGERGVRLSGGQRQRIGIARTLYHDPQVLVMDEATAALDNETERLFMDALASLSGQRTIIIIAHRLTTVQQCDKIFFLRDGKLVGEGNYDELLESCSAFQRMAGAGHF